MSLNQDLLDAGVNLTEMARESHFKGETYGNLYEVLRKERLGLPIKPGSAQDRRLQLLRSYLAGVLDETVGVIRAEEMPTDPDGRAVEVGEQWRIQRAQTTPVPRGLVLVREPIRIKGQLCGPGSLITLTMQHGPLGPGTYMFLSAYARPEEPSTPTEINLYGGAGYLRAKTGKDGLPTWYASHRTVRPDVFRRGRPPAPRRPTPDSEFTPEGEDDE